MFSRQTFGGQDHSPLTESETKRREAQVKTFAEHVENAKHKREHQVSEGFKLKLHGAFNKMLQQTEQAQTMSQLESMMQQ